MFMKSQFTKNHTATFIFSLQYHLMAKLYDDFIRVD